MESVQIMRMVRKTERNWEDVFLTEIIIIKIIRLAQEGTTTNYTRSALKGRLRNNVEQEFHE